MHRIEAGPGAVVVAVAIALATLFALTCDGCPPAGDSDSTRSPA